MKPRHLWSRACRERQLSRSQLLDLSDETILRRVIAIIISAIGSYEPERTTRGMQRANTRDERLPRSGERLSGSRSTKPGQQR